MVGIAFKRKGFTLSIYTLSAPFQAETGKFKKLKQKNQIVRRDCKLNVAVYIQSHAAGIATNIF